MSSHDEIQVKLPGGSTLAVRDCGFDLLLYVLYKNQFDKKKIEQEIDWICENNTDPGQLQSLLKKSLHQFSSEMANKILAKSIEEGISHQKVAEDMLVDVNKIQYTIAESTASLREVLHLRKKIFVSEEGYPPSGVTNGFEKESLHLMATHRKDLVGCVSIAFESPKGIPMDKFMDLTKYKKDKKVVEVDKLAVIGEKRKKELSFHLMWLCYTIAKFWGAQTMFIFTLSKKTENISLYSRFGFKQIGTFEIFAGEKATAMMLDFEDFDTYEKRLNTQELLRLGKKLLTKFSLKGFS